MASVGRLFSTGQGSLAMVFGAMRVLSRFMDNTSAAKIGNLLHGGWHLALQREQVRSWPAVLKVDISPLCSLRCSYCVHADAADSPALGGQSFNAGQRMSVAQFQRIVDEVKGKTAMVSLFYLGDPLMHRDLDELCAIAARADLNTHVSTHFSYALSDDRIRRLVTSGLSHLTVCVDGMTQQNYERTRIGGRLDRVLDNLRRVCQVRKELGRSFPKVEVQFLRFAHNLHELDAARALSREWGVDQFTDFPGTLDNCTSFDPGGRDLYTPKPNTLLPQCFMPYVVMVIKFNGDVIPCCYHRLGEQYVGGKDARVIGNVFQTSVREVWNSPAYRLLRRMVSQPARSEPDGAASRSFCAGCTQIFDVHRAPQVPAEPRRVPIVLARSTDPSRLT